MCYFCVTLMTINSWKVIFLSKYTIFFFISESPDAVSSIPFTALIIGLVAGAIVILIPLAIFIYLRVKRSHSKRYDVYVHSTTLNYDKNATYEQMYHENNSVVELSHVS